jgi:hypothetical protein
LWSLRRQDDPLEAPAFGQRQASGVIADTSIDLVGAIGRHVLARLMPRPPPARLPRIVKRAISKYQARGSNVDRARYKVTVSIEIHAAPDP